MRFAFLSAALWVACFVYPVTPAWAEAGFSGMQVQGVSKKIAAALSMEKPIGVMIRDVALGGPAAKAELKRGDIIVVFNGTKIDTFNRLVQAVQKTKPNQTIKLSVLRQGKPLDITLKLGSRPEAWNVIKGSVVAIPSSGLTLAAVTKKIRKRFNIRWGSIGVLITLIAPEFADSMQLERGDLIIQVNQKNVWKPEQVADAYARAKKEGRKQLLILVERVSGFQFLLLAVK